MVSKKSALNAKKSTTQKSIAKKPTTTKVTTVKAVDSAPSASRRLNLTRSPLVAAGLAEFIGAFLLTAVFMVVQGNPLYVGFGLVAVVLIVGAVSGAHVNPLVTIGAWVTRKIGSVRALVYIVAQILGAMLAFAVLSAFVNGAAEVTKEAAMYGQVGAHLFETAKVPAGKEWGILAAELLGSVIFAYAFAAARRTADKVAAAFTIGFGLFLALIVAGLGSAAIIGGAAILNPAVAIAVQAFTNGENSVEFWNIAIYAIIPLFGGVIGFALNDLIAKNSDANVEL